jgi:hypothetical protein
LLNFGGHGFGTEKIKFSLAEVTWQPAIKNIKMSINGAIVSMYQSQCLVVSGKRNESFLFLVQALWDLALFQLVKGDFPQGILFTSSGSSSRGIMGFYLKNGKFCA